jgi:hypothetical protein
MGSFHSSMNVQADFFSAGEQRIQEKAMTKRHMPFLYGLMLGTLQRGAKGNDDLDEVDDGLPLETDVSSPEEFAEVAYHQTLNGPARISARHKRVCLLTFPFRMGP